MPITSSAKKALRSSLKKHKFNLRRKESMKSSVKEVKKLVVAHKKSEAEANLAKAYKAIDKAAKSGVIKKNTASRKKSRLAKAVAGAK